MHQTKMSDTIQVYTDNAKMVELLELMAKDPGTGLVEKFDELYPGFRQAVVDGHKEIGEFTTGTVSVVIYRNCRVQVWADSQYDIEPSKIRKVIPAGTHMAGNFIAR